ncbi:unnamed protein product [Paramecium sonneborni]|uniref:Aminotransferase class I/classII large domain-containing protein n=1 Tax=Paramecium sonneborni TaxID=65129 RepID=A0A8S1PDF2_9CILI|nr:unnamed protein product [Paramecium sonneborni]
MQNSIISDRLKPYLGPQIYTQFTQLAIQKECVNLGQGFPNYPSPQFLRQAISEEALVESLQYTSTSGLPRLLKSGAEFFSKHIGISIDSEKEISIGAGAQTILVSVFQAILNKGDEVICFDPSFDVYKPMIEFQGAKQIGIALKIGKWNNKEEMLRKFENGIFRQDKEDIWKIDLDSLKYHLNDKTKMIILNSPQNPNGKVYDQEELDQLADILENYPNVVICEDAAYHHLPFGDYEIFNYPRSISHKRLSKKTICVISAGKMFSATGLRVGFAIGPESIIKGVKAAQTYHLFCLNPIMQAATAKSLELCMDGQYFKEKRIFYEKQAQTLLKGLVESRLNLNYMVPSGGYFLLTDISNVEIPEQYFIHPDTKETLSRDFAFVYYLANEFGVVCIPMSPYYSDKRIGEKLVRWAFCKTDETIQEACRRLK